MYNIGNKCDNCFKTIEAFDWAVSSCSLQSLPINTNHINQIREVTSKFAVCEPNSIPPPPRPSSVESRRETASTIHVKRKSRSGSNDVPEKRGVQCWDMLVELMFMCKCLQAGILRSVIGVSHNKGILVNNTQKRNDIFYFATLAVVTRLFPVISSLA